MTSQKNIDELCFETERLMKTAGLVKEAGPAFETFKKDVDMAVKAGQDLEETYTKHLTALTKEENTEKGTITKAREYMASAAATPGHRQPGMSMPPATSEADDCCAEDPQTAIAADFAIAQLVKIADALDGKGFSVVANEIDEAIQKIAAKKKPGLTYKAWLKKLEKMEGPVEKFQKVYEKALDAAKKDGMKKKEAEEQALKAAVAKLPKKYVDEPLTKKK